MFIELDRNEPAQLDPEPRRPPLRHRARPWAAALAVAAVLAAGSGSAVPRPTLQLVAEIVVKAEAELITFDQNLLIAEPNTLASFDPQTARLRWRLQTGLQRQWVEAEDNLLVVTGSGAATDPAGAATMAIVPETGEVRWRVTGYLERMGGFMVSHEVRYAPVAVARLTVYNRAAQRLWSLDPVAPLHTLDDTRQAVVTLDGASGEVVEYRLDNGSVISRAVVPEFKGASAVYGSGEEMTVQFPDGSSITRRGSGFVNPASEMPEIPIEGRFEFGGEQHDCGSLWCVYPAFGIGLMVKDKATGEVVYRDERWSSPIRTDFGIVGLGFGGEQDANVIMVFDSATRRHRRITGWSLLGIRPQPREQAWHGPVYLVASAPSRTFFAILDGTEVHIAGSVPHEHLLQCQATTDLVACRVDPKTIKIWHPVR